MAKLKFIGVAQAISQVTEITIGGTWSAGETVRLTINGKYVEYVAQGGDTAALVAAGLQAAADASTDAEFTEVTFTVATTKVTATGTAGIPFTITTSETAASGTSSASTTVSATGPHHWDNAANWSTGSVPVNSDEVYVELSSVWIKYGFPTGLTLAKFIMTAGSVGLPDENANGYAEYRSTYLTISSAIVTIYGGSTVRISTESANTVVTVDKSGTADIKTNHSSAAVYSLRGTTRFVPSDGETGQASIVRCNANAVLEIGAGATVATVLSAGRSEIRGAITTLTVEGDICTLKNGSSTTVNVNGGEFSYESTSTITTANLAAGVFDCSGDVRQKTITNFNFNGGTLVNPNRVITFTNGIIPGVDLLQAG